MMSKYASILVIRTYIALYNRMNVVEEIIGIEEREGVGKNWAVDGLYNVWESNKCK